MTARSTVLEFISFYTASLVRHDVVSEDHKVLTLNFYDTHTYQDVLVKLNKIDEVYSELCFLFKVSKSEYPLQIIKIETGSLLVVVIGNLAVIGFFIWLLKESIKFVHRNYTLEGQIESIPKKIDAADKVLNFTKKLEEHGVETSNIKDDLGKSMLKIISPLNELVSNQAKMMISGEEISVGQELEQKYLQDSEQRLIGDGNQIDTSNVESADKK